MEKITYSGNVKILRKLSTGELKTLAEYKNEGSLNLFNLLLDSLDCTYISNIDKERKPKYLAIVDDDNTDLLNNNNNWFQALNITRLPVDNNIYALQLEFYVNGYNTSKKDAKLLLLSAEDKKDITARTIASINTNKPYPINSDETHVIRWTLSLKNG